jgi:hypothetical protein
MSDEIFELSKVWNDFVAHKASSFQSKNLSVEMFLRKLNFFVAPSNIFQQRHKCIKFNITGQKFYLTL